MVVADGWWLTTMGKIFRTFLPTRQTMTSTSYTNPVTATLTGIFDMFRHRPPIGKLTPEERLDGMTCLITGANSGLGLGTARALAKRGARLILACRSGIPQTAEVLKLETGNPQIEMVKLDLADYASIDRCCAELRERGVRLDRVILNAGIVPPKAVRTAQGFEMMFGVHFLGNMRFVLGLLRDGTIPNDVFAAAAGADTRMPDVRPRIVFVSSETHRTGRPIDLATLGEFVEYNTMGSMAQYGYSKLALTTFARELASRLAPGGDVQVAVHALCPGPVDSNIARGAPAWIKPLLEPLKRLLFASPDKACEPSVYLTVAHAIEGRTGIYLHLMSEKEPAAQATDPAIRKGVWEAGMRFLAMDKAH
ncbi:MAG TPA: SDR family NAD(P)-dependent oxidoreductase [Rhodocyclaceae bacterium]|nr:SDR family NAD(P)-dependent oxidoreductase [Rhodocyclaceae bacterium]